MTTADFNRILTHPSLPRELADAVASEIHYGLAHRDSRVLLGAALEGVLLTRLPELHRATYPDPLTSARLLAKDPLMGSRRLWQAQEKSDILDLLERTTTCAQLLEFWARLRKEYRKREVEDKIRYADGRPADLAALAPPLQQSQQAA